jgi:hypothetical protein
VEGHPLLAVVVTVLVLVVRAALLALPLPLLPPLSLSPCSCCCCCGQLHAQAWGRQPCWPLPPMHPHWWSTLGWWSTHPWVKGRGLTGAYQVDRNAPGLCHMWFALFSRGGCTIHCLLLSSVYYHVWRAVGVSPAASPPPCFLHAGLLAQVLLAPSVCQAGAFVSPVVTATLLDGACGCKGGWQHLWQHMCAGAAVVAQLRCGAAIVVLPV